jgi:acyl carrier protein
MENKFIELIKETLDIDDRELQMSDKFREYEEWNSLALLSVIATIDEEYDVVIEGNVFQKLQTLEELYIEIQKRV